MITQRFNTHVPWRLSGRAKNNHFFGFAFLLNYVCDNLPDHGKALEIGSYMGESTQIIASSGIFSEIHSVDPFKGTEEFNKEFGYTWSKVKSEYNKNTRYFNNIYHHQGYSYDEVPKFPNGEFDFIYIDASHKYEDVKQDIELCLPKLKYKGIIAGHDYSWSDVKKAVDEKFNPEEVLVFLDSSWAYIKN